MRYSIELLDVTDSKAVTDFVVSTETSFGRIGLCVTNSGGPPSNLFKSTSPEAWRSALDQLLMRTIYLVEEVLPLMHKNKWGSLITATSSAATSERPNHENGASIVVADPLVRSLP